MGGRRCSSEGSHPGPPLLAPALLVPVLLAACLLAVTTAACAPSSSGAATDGAVPTPKQGGTYDYPLAVDPGSFDLSLPQSSDCWAVLHQVYEGLVQVGGADRRHDEDGPLPGRELERERRRDGLDVQAATTGSCSRRPCRARSSRRTSSRTCATWPTPRMRATWRSCTPRSRARTTTAWRIRGARRRGHRSLHRPLHAQAPVLRVPRHSRQPGLLGLAGGPPERGGSQGLRGSPRGHGAVPVPQEGPRHVRRPGPQPRMVGHVRRAVHRRHPLPRCSAASPR